MALPIRPAVAQGRCAHATFGDPTHGRTRSALFRRAGQDIAAPPLGGPRIAPPAEFFDDGPAQRAVQVRVIESFQNVLERLALRDGVCWSMLVEALHVAVPRELLGH